MEEKMAGTNGGSSGSKGAGEIRQLTELVLQMQAELHEMKVAVSEGHRQWDLVVPESPNTSLTTHFSGREERSLFTPRPTPKPRTRISRTPIAPANTPVTARSVLDESLSTELSDCPTTSAEAKQSDDKQKASEEKLEKGKDAPVEVKTRRPNITPDRFNGKIPWCDFLQHFEACKLANGWTEGQAKIFLAASLQGVAVKVLGSQQEGGKNMSYSQLVRLLEERFGPGQLAENHLVELRHRRQGSKESLQELGQAIRELSGLAYPELTDEGRDRLARGHFSDAVEDQAIREGIFRARPKTLEEAIRAAIATEGFLKVEEQRGGKKLKYARVLEDDGKPEWQKFQVDLLKRQKEMEQAISESRKEMKTLMEQIAMGGKGPTDRRRAGHAGGTYPRERRKPAAGDVCFRCQETGHFARNCSRPYGNKPKKSGNELQLTPGPGGELEDHQGREEKRAEKPQS